MAPVDSLRGTASQKRITGRVSVHHTDLFNLMANTEVKKNTIREGAKPAFSIRYLFHISGRLLPILALLVITILYSHQLSLEEYSLFQSVWMYSALISVILGYGITTIIFSSETSVLHTYISENKKKILIAYFSITLMAGILFLIMAKGYSATLKTAVFAFIFLQNLNTVAESWLIKNQGQLKYLLINLVYSVLFLIWHILVLAQKPFELEKLIWGVLLLSIGKFAVLLFLRPEKNNSPIKETPFPFSNKQFQSHWIFAGINDIIGVTSKWADKLILIYLLTPPDFALFFNGTIDVPLVAMLISITGNYMMMEITKEEKSASRIIRLFRENSLMISSFITPLFFFLLFFRHEIFFTLFGAKYLPALEIFSVSIFILLIRFNHFGGLLQIYSRSDLVTYGSLIDLALAIAFVFILYPIWGLPGAAAASIISTLVQNSFYLVNAAKLIGCPFSALIPARALMLRLVLSGIVFYLLKILTSSLPAPTAMTIGVAALIFLSLILGQRFYRQMFKNAL